MVGMRWDTPCQETSFVLLGQPNPTPVSRLGLIAPAAFCSQPHGEADLQVENCTKNNPRSDSI